MNTDPTRPGFSWRNVSWLTWALAALAVITFLIIASPPAYYPYPVPMMGGSYGVGVEGAPRQGVMIDNDTAVSNAPSAPQEAGGSVSIAPERYPYPYPRRDVPASDTREFLKVYYNAEMQTRDVQGLTRRVETTVRGYEGRVDSQSSSPKYGHVSFVVPQEKYDAFRAELEGLVGSRFLAVSVNAENLLPQKQSLEEQQREASTTLAGYQSSRQSLISTHLKAVAQLQAQIDADARELSNLEEQPTNSEIEAQIRVVAASLASLRSRLASENASYSSQLASLDAQIKSVQDWQKGIVKQDESLMEDVATVSGTVSLRYISLWEMLQLYLPGYTIPAIFALLALGSLWRDRRHYTRHQVAGLGV